MKVILLCSCKVCKSEYNENQLYLQRGVDGKKIYECPKCGGDLDCTEYVEVVVDGNIEYCT